MSELRYSDTYLLGLRVLESANELGEYAGKVLAGLGADVIKVEPPEGEETRRYGPHFQDGHGDPNRSLHFWHYNHGKRGVALDLDSNEGRQTYRRLAQSADVVLDTRPPGYMEERGLGFEAFVKANPGLIYAKVTPFGETGPWAQFAGSDLVHLALGGMMKNCGYDPDPFGHYETPPIAPQMWHAYHIAGELTAMSILGALYHKLSTGQGQYLSAPVHQATSSNTESDFPAWTALRAPLLRQTARHATQDMSDRGTTPTKDGRYVLPYTTYVKNFPSSWDQDIATLRKYGMQADLDEPRWQDPEYRAAHQQHIADVMDKLIKRTTYDSGLWQEMVGLGLTWAPLRRPEENLADPHWSERDIFTEVHHPELDATFTYVGARWVSEEASWKLDRRAPLLGEHNAQVSVDWEVGRPTPVHTAVRSVESPQNSKVGKPFALDGVRVVDLGWMVASAGAGRYLAAMGAEVVKVEHMSRLDGMRFAGTTYPDGGRAERDAATEPLRDRPVTTVNQSASFNETNSGKLGLSLNLKKPEAKQILAELIRNADVLIEGYSPGTMKRMGFGYERLKELNPDIIYVQQSGLGEKGTYAGARAFGPTAQAFSGLTEMSGLPAPWQAAGIGYSYLDWFGAYNVATAVLAGLYRRELTGEGCHIDASQVEVGLYLSGTAILDYTANGHAWERYGNRSPYKPAAPSGAYRAMGEDNWVAISAFTEEQWTATTGVFGNPTWASDPKFNTLEARLRNQDELDRFMNEATADWDRYELMFALQSAAVPAGVTQDAGDRVDVDPQLRALGFVTELRQSEAGVWPLRSHPVHMAETPAYMGGIKDRAAPSYGEDTDEVLRRWLGLSVADVTRLHEDDIV